MKKVRSVLLSPAAVEVLIIEALFLTAMLGPWLVETRHVSPNIVVLAGAALSLGLLIASDRHVMCDKGLDHCPAVRAFNILGGAMMCLAAWVLASAVHDMLFAMLHAPASTCASFDHCLTPDNENLLRLGIFAAAGWFLAGGSTSSLAVVIGQSQGAHSAAKGIA